MIGTEFRCKNEILLTTAGLPLYPVDFDQIIINKKLYKKIRVTDQIEVNKFTVSQEAHVARIIELKEMPQKEYDKVHKYLSNNQGETESNEK